MRKYFLVCCLSLFITSHAHAISSVLIEVDRGRTEVTEK